MDQKKKAILTWRPESLKKFCDLLAYQYSGRWVALVGNFLNYDVKKHRIQKFIPHLQEAFNLDEDWFVNNSHSIFTFGGIVGTPHRDYTYFQRSGGWELNRETTVGVRFQPVGMNPRWSLFQPNCREIHDCPLCDYKEERKALLTEFMSVNEQFGEFLQTRHNDVRYNEGFVRLGADHMDCGSDDGSYYNKEDFLDENIDPKNNRYLYHGTKKIGAKFAQTMADKLAKKRKENYDPTESDEERKEAAKHGKYDAKNLTRFWL